MELQFFINGENSLYTLLDLPLSMNILKSNIMKLELGSLIFFALLVSASTISLISMIIGFEPLERIWFYLFFPNLLIYETPILGLIVNFIFYAFFGFIIFLGFSTRRSKPDWLIHIFLTLLVLAHLGFFVIAYSAVDVLTKT